MIQVVQAGLEDRGMVLALVEKLLRELEETPDEFEGIERGRVLRDLDAAGERFSAFVALGPQAEAVGVATLFEAFAIYAGGHYGIIDEMYVEPEYRSRGVGGKLLDAVKDHARRRGWMRIDVTAPPGKRWERTVKFYEAQGFVFTGPKMRLRLGSGAS